MYEYIKGILTKITAKYIVTELEKRGIERLMVEGGAEVLRMFLDEGMADTLRLAVNPRLRLGGRGGGLGPWACLCACRPP